MASDLPEDSQADSALEPPPPFHPQQSPIYPVYAPFPNTCAASASIPCFDLPLAPFYINLDEYERIQNIGRGAFGSVYSARDRETGAHFAIKTGSH
jgi:serine/threonine protein kinase